MILIEKVYDKELKAKYAKEVLYDLPEWFGHPDSTAEYIKDSRAFDFWVALDGLEIVGFVTLTNSSQDCANVHCLGVKKVYHRSGVGNRLMMELEEYAKNIYSYIQVKTVDEGYYAEYDITNHFYKKCGYKKLEVFPYLWDERNPCLVLIKKL
ncbi:GNAT family N-acetyltransferase [Alkalicoccobacillus porphyridii]|uniref:GNAT family N-acetyltransferase n=1 Tax=Alkalicoccobacillus porphyridii TaxID=2597270 RepID=A0A554A2S5_9BACI|nr:GNAT family N-acetyltransferase [Alkalicoccobacillus porphyridii]TSB48000.1 GNAT family N-acetyltransferase [Alkalicoccobacillus porphyridii]